MVVRKCHVAITAFFMCLLSCKAVDPRLVQVVSDLEHGSLPSALDTTLNSPAKLDVNASSQIISGTSLQPDVLGPSVSPQSSTVVPASAIISSTTVKDTTPPIPSPSTVKPDPDTKPTTKPTTPTPSTVKPDPVTKPTPKPTTPTPSTVNPGPDTTTKPTEKPSTPTTAPTPTPSSPTTSSTEKPTPTTPKHVTTGVPVTTAAPAPHHNRQFDGPSFIGGIVLASGLMAIGFVAFKFYKARTERNYHTL